MDEVNKQQKEIDELNEVIKGLEKENEGLNELIDQYQKTIKQKEDDLDYVVGLMNEIKDIARKV